MGACSSWNHPLTPTQNRRGDHPQHPAHPLAVKFQFSTAATFLLLPDALLRLTLLRSWPRHPKNNGGLAVVPSHRFSATFRTPTFSFSCNVATTFFIASISAARVASFSLAALSCATSFLSFSI